MSVPPGRNTAVATYTTTSPLSVGVHAIDAAFTAAKNTDFLPGDGTMSLEVDLATATTLTSSVSGSSATLGTSVTFTAKVSAAASAGVTPDGTVTFYDGASVLGGPVAINAGGVATFVANSLAVGPHSITATSISVFALPPRRFTASGMGIDSTTDQLSGVRPGAVVSIRFLRSATAASVQTAPIGTWWSAVTISVAPA